MTGSGRDALVDFLKSQLLGPMAGVNEELSNRPLENYTTGVLYPMEQDNSHRVIADNDLHFDDFADIDAIEDQNGEMVDDALSNSTIRNPSSVAISFLAIPDNQNELPIIQTTISGAMYDNAGQKWQRRELEEHKSEISATNKSINHSLWNCCELITKWRKADSGAFIVTVALVNKGKPTTPIDSSCIFQVGIRCSVSNGSIGVYPSVENLLTSHDESELRLRYEHQKVFSVGHGCSGDWEEVDGQVVAVRSEFIPTVNVPPMEVSSGDNNEILKLTFLKDASRENLKKHLDGFINGYENWLNNQKEVAADRNLTEKTREAADRIFSKIQTAINRMRDGSKVLFDNADALVAFRLSQEAMIRQMEHSGPKYAGSQHEVTDSPEMPELSEYQESKAAWRPFQLAYILLCLESLINKSSEDREIVDLIWASTGAGKTEAYLALAATEIIYRRKTAAEKAGGTVVLTRYTLRLLTLQQFERTARLACSLETLRRSAGNEFLGEEEISIGLWVGNKTHRTFATAKRVGREIINARNPQGIAGFKLRKCPWCGTEIIPKRDSTKRENYGFIAESNQFQFNCPNSQCDFNSKLPVQVVDEALYKSPPTILIGTIDKYARMPWLEGPGNFFGRLGNLPPSLIIQDELHLLQGPLGTTSGLYEAAINSICDLRGGSPKILASTATIREAESQIKAIYGNKTQLFPPAGIDSRDGYFVQENTSKPGRLYLGILSPITTPATSFIRTSAVLLQAHPSLSANDALSEEDKDGYWTLIAYHNSIRELGATLSAAHDDIDARLDYIAPLNNRRPLSADVIRELSSKVLDSELTGTLNRLERHYDHEDSLSFVACTNMLSVGVDVQRLGLMIVHGQPMTTSEYIQATSRVGRGKTPGLVVSHYSSTKSRDRSHYERFRGYHSALYRAVEPTSVTPFSLPSRRRSLKGALVLLIRHGIDGMESRNAAGKFDSRSANIVGAVEAFLSRCKSADPTEYAETKEMIDALLEEWDIAKSRNSELMYDQGGKDAQKGLLKDFNGPDIGYWEAMHSMRNVDAESPLQILKVKS